MRWITTNVTFGIEFIPPFQGSIREVMTRSRGRRASRLPLAIIFRAVGAEVQIYSPTGLPLLVPQRCRRIQTRGAEGREPGGEDGDDQE